MQHQLYKNTHSSRQTHTASGWSVGLWCRLLNGIHHSGTLIIPELSILTLGASIQAPRCDSTFVAFGRTHFVPQMREGRVMNANRLSQLFAKADHDCFLKA